MIKETRKLEDIPPSQRPGAAEAAAAKVAAAHLPAPWEETYLDTLADTGQKAKAARLASIGLRVVARRRREAPFFAQLECEAFEASFDFFESEAIRRAVEGVEVSRPGRNGELITRTIYSDTLLLKLLERYVWTEPHQKSSPASSSGVQTPNPHAEYPHNLHKFATTPEDMVWARDMLEKSRKKYLECSDETAARAKAFASTSSP